MRVAAAIAALALATVGLGPIPPAAAIGPATSAVTVRKTVQRTFLADGRTTVVDKRNIALTVDQTTGLRSLQLIKVSWSGARPTAGITPDQNSDLAQNEEYPFALFECRGIDSAAHPLSPDTCWTQYGDERFSYGADDPAYPAWRSDAKAAAAERGAIVGAPARQTPQCTSLLFGTTYQRWLPFVGADGTVYPGGVQGCAGQAPEASPANLSGNLSLPSNETFGVSDAHGTGSTNFDVFTAEDHASLGCSSTVPCSLVAVPIVGISCDANGELLPASSRPAPADAPAAAANCTGSGNFAPGQTLPSQAPGDPAVSGALWWSASNWSNRLSVPLTFAPADNVCSLHGSGAPVDVYGSELLVQATTSWAPYFCLNSHLFDLNHVQTPEPQARSLLAQGNVEAIYTSQPPDAPYPVPTVNAPVAVSGFGIAYALDNADGQPVAHLKLDGRLLAKLLTESYPSQIFVRAAYTALADNPLNITFDPEFQALNPGIPARTADAAATLLTVNSDSDVVSALTSYIDADPEARAWLDGEPDPWGMVVNPAYKKIALPVDNWPLLDTFEPLDEYQPGRNDCLYAAPTPYLPLVAAPTARLFSIGLDLQFALAQSQTTCVLPSPIPGSLAGAKLVANGRQASGRRAMFGTVSLGDAAREGLTLASLESRSTVGRGDRITDASGRTFVAPDPAGLRAAAQTLRPDPRSGTWPIDHTALRTTPANAAAYPGLMVVYAAVPTRGLGSMLGSQYGKFLSFAAARGQQAGTAQGDLPDGFLPMTGANGLGTLANFTARAATAVSAQQGAVPPLVAPGPTPSSSSGPAPTASTTPAAPGVPTGATNLGGNPQVPVGGGNGPTNPVPAGPSTRGASPTARGAASSGAPRTIDAEPVSARTPLLGSTVAGWALPLMFAIAIAASAGAIAIRLRAGGSRTR